MTFSRCGVDDIVRNLTIGTRFRLGDGFGQDLERDSHVVVKSIADVRVRLLDHVVIRRVLQPPPTVTAASSVWPPTRSRPPCSTDRTPWRPDRRPIEPSPHCYTAPGPL